MVKIFFKSIKSWNNNLYLFSKQKKIQFLKGDIQEDISQIFGFNNWSDLMMNYKKISKNCFK